MKRDRLTNIAASIHARLLNQARSSGRSFNDLAQLYAMERFLYRLSQSRHAGRFILKGALNADSYRTTRDIDVLGRIGNEVHTVVSVIQDICGQSVEADGLIFDPASVRGEMIAEEADYAGIRLAFRGSLGKMRLAMRIDVGFGDVVTPEAREVEFPTLLAMPAPRLKAYPPETTVAEKLQVMFRLGEATSRMKDFHDIWWLARTFAFHGRTLAQAIAATCERRGTPVPTKPTALTPRFSADPSKVAQWACISSAAEPNELPRGLRRGRRGGRAIPTAGCGSAQPRRSVRAGVATCRPLDIRDPGSGCSTASPGASRLSPRATCPIARGAVRPSWPGTPTSGCARRRIAALCVGAVWLSHAVSRDGSHQRPRCVCTDGSNPIIWCRPLNAQRNMINTTERDDNPLANLEPYYELVQAHYDLSNEFFALVLDSTMTYSCAFFEREDMALEEAQLAKIDLALGKCDLQPGQRLLDIGCGWGSTLCRAVERYGVDVVGLTLSQNQYLYASEALRHITTKAGRAEIRLNGWEDFDEPVDAIVSIGAFEHFRMERYGRFFSRCRRMLPTGGRMLLQTIVHVDQKMLRERGIAVTHEDVLFGKFVRTHVFPGGQLCVADLVIRHAERAGFRIAQTQSLQPHYARTLDTWAENLEAARDRAVALASQEVYEVFARYFEGCARYFRSGHLDVIQFSLEAD